MESSGKSTSASYEHLTLRGIGYNSIAKLLMYVFSAIASVVLGRCLLASDYGIVSFAFIFINFMANFADFGIGSALVQRKELDKTALDTAFTMKLLIGIAVVIATLGLSSLAPIFFDDPQVVVIIRLLSLYFLITTISFLPTALLTREMDFKKISLAEITLSVLNSLVAIVLALKGYGYWSIVVAYLFANVVSAVMLYLFRPVPLKLHFDRNIAREFFNFGGYLFLAGLLVFLIFNLDNLIIGSINGAKDLGYYAIAYNWGSMICLLMYMVVLRVIFPLMAKVQDQEARMRTAYLKTVEYSGYLVIMVNVILFTVSRDFLVTILGQNSDKWLPALAALRILCLYGILRGLIEPIGQVIIARGDTKTLFKANTVASLFEAAAVYPALRYYGIEGIAWTVTLAYLLQGFVYYPYLKNRLQVRISDLARAVRPSFCAAVPILLFFPLLAGSHERSIVIILLKMLLLALAYIGILGIITRWELARLVGGLLAGRERSG